MSESKVGTYPVAELSICVVRLTTTTWKDKRGVYIKKSLNFLKRKCEGHNILDEDCSMGDVEEVISRIININYAKDGVYIVEMCNENKDWETGYIDDYDYQLVST